MIDFYKMALERFHNISPEWQIAVLSRVDTPDGFIRVTGAIPDGVYTRGPRKGSPRFPPEKKRQVVWLKDEELQAAKDHYERSTGRCHECEGSGEVIAGWKASIGKYYKPCTRCNGTGKSPQSEASTSQPSP